MTPAEPKPHYLVRRPWTIALLVAFAATILLGRLRLYPAPLHSDICTYALIGHEMSKGRVLYADLWERKPPLLYATFAAAERVVGYGRQEILLVNVAAAWATLAGVYLAATNGGGGGLFAAGLWTLLSADLGLTANQPDPEVFISATLVSAVAILVRPPAERPVRRITTVLGVGGLLAAATLYKQNSAFACVALLLGPVIASAPGGGRSIVRALVDSTIAGLVVVLAWLGVLGHAYVAGRLPATVDVLFRQNLAYSGGGVGQNFFRALTPSHLFPPFMSWAIGPVVLLVAGQWHLRQSPGSSRPWTVWIFWAIGTWATIAVTGYVYAHYYQLWLPVACVGGGWAAARLWQASPARSAGLRRGIVAIVVVSLAFREAIQFTLPPDEWVRRQFPYYSVADQNAFGRKLAVLLRPDETFWELGEDNCLYFLSGHSPPSGLLFIDPLIYGGETDRYWRRLISDLDRHPPDVVVVSTDWLKFFPPESPIFPWIRNHYQPCPTAFGRPTYRLFLRP